MAALYVSLERLSPAVAGNAQPVVMLPDLAGHDTGRNPEAEGARRDTLGTMRNRHCAAVSWDGTKWPRREPTRTCRLQPARSRSVPVLICAGLMLNLRPEVTNR